MKGKRYRYMRCGKCGMSFYVWTYFGRFLCVFFCLYLWGLICMPVNASAATVDSDTWKENETQLMQELPLSEIQDVLDAGEDYQINFSSLLRQLLNGEEPDKETVFRKGIEFVFRDLMEYRMLLFQILTLTLAFSFLHHFMYLFENDQVSRMCFYLYFLVLMTLLMKSYLLTHDLLRQVLEQQVNFMNALLPAFCMTMVFASAQTTAAVFYQLSLLVIYLVERVMLTFVVPGIHIFVALAMLDHMTERRLISRLVRLLKKFLIWSMRILLAGVTGMNVIETMIAPSMDNLKKLSVTRTLGMIPGLGNTAEAVSNMFLGSALVIKNGIGAAALVILALICLVPFLKLAVITLFFKAAGALIQPIADVRVCGCISSMGEGTGLLLRALTTGMLLFMITIAVVVTAVR